MPPPGQPVRTRLEARVAYRWRTTSTARMRSRRPANRPVVRLLLTLVILGTAGLVAQPLLSLSESPPLLPAQPPYRLTMTPPPTGGTVTGNGLACGTGGAACAVTFGSATTAALTATPDTGYTFTGWGGDCAGTAASTTVQVDTVRTCSALFTATLARCEQHPADTNSDFRLAIGEVTAYGAAWKKGDTWTVPPVPIPIGYVTRAGYLWRIGETYRRDVGDGPFCWLPLIAGDAVLTSVDPAAGEQGAGPIVATVTASGTHFFQGTTEVSFGAGITVSGVQVQSLTQLTASLAIAAGAAAGPRDVSAITDGEVATLAGAFHVTVHRSVPVPNAGGPYNGTAGIAVSFDGSLSTDPDGNPLAFTWDFGDGNTGSGTTPSHTYAEAGQFSVTLRVDNGHGEAANAATTVSISPASVNPGIGFLRGGAFDDSRSLPLAAPIIRLLRAGGQPLPSPPATGGDDQGRFLAQAAEGEALVEVSASGFTSVYRTASVVGRASVTLLDARLTPLEPASQPITSALGGLARTPDGGQSVQFMAGSLPADAAVGVTPLSGQGLPLRLPFGWSPVAAVDVRPLATSLGVPAVWRAVNAAGIPRSRELALARFDRDAHRWIVGGAAAISGDGQFIEAAIDRLGAWVIVAPDAAPFTPPASQPGSELTGVAEPQLPGTISATGHVSPRTAPPGQQARAIGEVVLQSSEPLVSGVRLQGRVTQRFDLQDGASVVPLPFTQDVLVYTDPATGLTSELRARIPITPSRNYSLQELLLGVVQVDVHQPGSNTNGILVDVGGGAFDDGAGARLTVPAGAVTSQTVIDLLPLPRDQLSAPVPAGLEFLGGVRFGLIGANLPQSATVSIPKPSDLPPDAQILLAQTFFDFLGVSHLRVAAVGTLDGNRIVSATQAGDLQLPGVVTGGEYAFVRATTPLGFAHGIVFAPDGTTPRTLALLTAETGPFADLTGTTGRYIAMTPVAATTRVFATDAPGNVGNNSVSPAQLNAVVTANVTLAALAPTVVSADPAQGATRVPLDTGLRVQFSKAIAAASVTETSVSLRQGGTPLTLQRFLSIDGRTLTLLPGHALSSATGYELVLTTDLRDPVGNALAASQTLSFTTIDTSRQTTAPGRLVARLPDDDGFVMLFGSPGTAEPSALVSVINLRSQETMTVVAQSDGSFRLRILALLGDELTVHFRNAAGQEADFKISQLENEDGLAGLGAAGGTVRGPGGRVATVLPRALVKAGTFRLLAGSTPNLPSLPAGDVVVDTLALTITGAQFNPLSSLTLFETQGRFAPATASALPFTATGSLVVAPDFLVGGALKFRAIAQDAQGNQVRVDASTTVRSGDPDRTIVETASEARFPRVFVSTPHEAVPNQEVDVTATVPTARVDFELPVPAGPLAAYLLVRETQLGTDSRLAILDTLVPAATDAGLRLRTAGRELPGVSQGGAYAVIGSPTALSFATGRLTGPALTVDVEGSPFVYETNGPNASFTVPVPANGPFTLRFVDPASGDLRGTFVGHSTGPGTIDVGEPLGHAAQTMTVSAKPDETWLAGIDMPIELTFSEPVDMRTVNAGTIVVTDASGHRVFGRFTESGDSRTVTFAPLRRLRYATRYRYTVTTRVTAASGAHLQAAFSREFTTFEPRALAAPDVGEPVKDVAVSGGVALAAGASGLSVFGIANPMQPVLRTRVAQAGGSSGVALTDGGFTDRAGTAVAGPVAVLSGGSQSAGGRVNVLGLQDPSGPLSLGAVSVGQAGVAGAGRIAIDGARAAVLDGVGASVLDLTQAVPSDPADATRGVLARSTAASLVNAKDVAYVGSKVLVVGDAGLTVLDAATLDVLGTRAADGPAVAVDGLPQVDVDIDGNGTIDPNTEHFDLAVAGGGADGTLRFYDISRPAAIRLVGVVHLAGDVQDVALSASEQLAYVAAGLAGVAIVDLHGPTSIQPLDVDFDGDDDRILGIVATAVSASRVSVDSARSLAVAGTGQRLSILQVAPMHAQILALRRDPFDEQPRYSQDVTDSGVGFLSDFGFRVEFSVPPTDHETHLVIEEDSSAGQLLTFADGGTVTPLDTGRGSVKIKIAQNDGSAPKTAVVRIVDTQGRTLDSRELHLNRPDLAEPLESLAAVLSPVQLTPDNPSKQLAIAGKMQSDVYHNVTREWTGTSYTMEDTPVASVDQEGLVTGRAGGTAIVYAANRGKSASATVIVGLPPVITGLEVNPQFLTITDLSARPQLGVTATFSDGSTQNLAPTDTTATSGHPSVLAIEGLTLVPLSDGLADVSLEYSGQSAHASIAVAQKIPAAVDGIEIVEMPSLVRVSTPALSVRARVNGTGSLDGFVVQFAMSGVGPVLPITGSTDLDGVAAGTLSGWNATGQATIVATVRRPSGGATLSASRSIAVRPDSPDFEPNDTLDTATQIDLGDRLTGTVGGADSQDVYSFTTTESGTIEIVGSADSVVSIVVDSSGTGVWQGTLLAGVPLTTGTLPAGSYRLLLQGGTSTSTYDVSSHLTQSPVVVADVQPRSGGPGTAVTVTGSGFSNDSTKVQVSFGGARGRIVSATPSMIQAIIPAWAVSAPVVVYVGEQRARGPRVDAGRNDVVLVPSVKGLDPNDIVADPTTGALMSMHRLLLRADVGVDLHAASGLVASYGGRIDGIIPYDNEYQAWFPVTSVYQLAEIKRQLETVPTVLGATWDAVVTPESVSSNERSGRHEYQWERNQVHLFEAYDYLRAHVSSPDARRVAVGIIDSGLNKTHPVASASGGGGPRVRFWDLQRLLVASADRAGPPLTFAATTDIRPSPYEEWRDLGDLDLDHPENSKSHCVRHGSLIASELLAPNGDLHSVSGIVTGIGADWYTDKIAVEIFAIGECHTKSSSLPSIGGVAVAKAAMAFVAELAENGADLGLVEESFRLDVVNMSFGATTSDYADGSRSTFDDAFDRMPSTLFVAAAGNKGIDAKNQRPAGLTYRHPNLISVAGAAPAAEDVLNGLQGNLSGPNQIDARAYFTHKSSNYGVLTSADVSVLQSTNHGSIDLAAPGVARVLGLETPSRVTGSSFAAPTVTGIAALILASGPSCGTPACIKKLLAKTADDITPSWDRFEILGLEKGMRRLNALAAVVDAVPGTGDTRAIVTDRGTDGRYTYLLLDVSAQTVADGAPLRGISIRPDLSAVGTPAISADGHTLFVPVLNQLAESGGSNPFWELNIEQYSLVTGGFLLRHRCTGQPPWNGGTVRLAASPDGRLIVISMGSLVLACDLSRDALLKATPSAGLEFAPMLFAPDAAALLAVGSLTGIQRLNTDLSNDQQSGVTGIQWTPDAVDRQGETSNGSPPDSFAVFQPPQPRALGRPGVMPRGLGWSSDGDPLSPMHSLLVVDGRPQIRSFSEGDTWKTRVEGGFVNVWDPNRGAVSWFPMVPRVLSAPNVVAQYPVDDPRFGAVPYAVAVRPDGKRAVLPLFAGNLAFLDLETQNQIMGFQAPSDARFKLVAGVSPSGLDGDAWPKQIEHVPLLYPAAASYSQDGRFVAVAHRGSSGHSSCATHPDARGCTQIGAVSFVLDRSITAGLQEAVGQHAVSPNLEPTIDVSPTVYSVVQVGTDVDVKLVSPVDVLIQPIASILTPKVGAQVWDTAPIVVTWNTDTAVNGVEFTLMSAPLACRTDPTTQCDWLPVVPVAPQPSTRSRRNTPLLFSERGFRDSMHNVLAGVDSADRSDKWFRLRVTLCSSDLSGGQSCSPDNTVTHIETFFVFSREG